MRRCSFSDEVVVAAAVAALESSQQLASAAAVAALESSQQLASAAAAVVVAEVGVPAFQEQVELAAALAVTAWEALAAALAVTAWEELAAEPVEQQEEEKLAVARRSAGVQ